MNRGVHFTSSSGGRASVIAFATEVNFLFISSKSIGLPGQSAHLIRRRHENLRDSGEREGKVCALS